MNCGFLVLTRKNKGKFFSCGIFIVIVQRVLVHRLLFRAKPNFRGGHKITCLLIMVGQAGREGILLTVTNRSTDRATFRHGPRQIFSVLPPTPLL